MKRVFVFALVMCAMTSVSMAQEPERKCDRQVTECAGGERDFVAEKLNLTPEQKAQMDAARNEMMQTRKQSRTDMRDAHEKFEAKMQEILTPEQYEQYRQMAPNRHGRGDMRDDVHHRGHRHGNYKHHGDRKCDGDSIQCRHGERKCDGDKAQCRHGERKCDGNKAQCRHGERKCDGDSIQCRHGERKCDGDKAQCRHGECTNK